MKSVSLALILTFFLVGCSGKSKKKAESQRLSDTQWVAVDILGVERQLVENFSMDQPMVLVMMPDSAFSCMSVCGRFSGRFFTEVPNAVTFQVTEQEDVFCLGRSIDQKLRDNILMTYRYLIENDSLKMFNGEDLQVVTWSRQKRS